MMVNRFAHLEDYAESQSKVPVTESLEKKTEYVPKSAFSKEKKDAYSKRPENPAFQMNRNDRGERNSMGDNGAFQMTRSDRREPRLGPMSENSAFQMNRGSRNEMSDNGAFQMTRGDRREPRMGPMSENPAFQMQRNDRGERNNMGENGAFQMNRGGNGMNDNPAFAAKKRRDDYDPYNLARHPSLVDPPKPKEITEEDIQSEELFPTLGSSTPSASGTKTPSATTTATNTPKVGWGAQANNQKVQPLTGSSSFKDLVKKAAEKTEQEKKDAEDKKRLQDEKEKQRKHTRIITLNIRAPGLKPQMSYDDFAGENGEEDLSTRTPYYSRIEEDDDDIGLDEDDN